MIRGAIEVADTERVAGWIVSESVVLRGTMALAFAGARCVGSGPIEIFRADLKEAGLGDGFAGFDFPITLRGRERLASVVIKLPCCDLALLQRHSEVVEAAGEQAADAGRFAMAAE